MLAVEPRDRGRWLAAVVERDRRAAPVIFVYVFEIIWGCARVLCCGANRTL